MSIDVRVSQGHSLSDSDWPNIVVVIDVLRAFSTAHYALAGGANKIVLTKEVEEALVIKRQNPQVILVGEVGGIPIPGFDFGNSPEQMTTAELRGKELVLRSSNGVQALADIPSKMECYACGLINARRTAEFIKEKAQQQTLKKIEIVASDPNGDDDLACAEYMRNVILGEKADFDTCRNRILMSSTAQKFRKGHKEFSAKDLELCTLEAYDDFVVKLSRSGRSRPHLIKEIIGS